MKILIVLVAFLFVPQFSWAADANRPAFPTPAPSSDPNHADAAAQAAAARAAQQAALPFVLQAIGFYTPKCMGGEKSNCGIYGQDSCTCAARAWQQLMDMQRSMAGAQSNSENHSSNGGGNGGPPGPGGNPGDIVRARNQMTTAGFKLNPDGSIASMPDGSAAPSAGGASGSGSGFASGDYKPPNFDQGKSGSAGGPEMKDKNDKSGRKGDQGGVAGGGGGGGSGSRPPDVAADPKKANVSGLSRKFGKDTVGVAGDNIFEMISRRYKANEKLLSK